MSRFAAPIAEQIWDMKYRLKEADGTPVDLSVEDSWRRIATGAGRGGNESPGAWEDRFYARAGGFQVPARGPDHRRAPAPGAM